MIEYIKGELTDLNPAQAVVEAAGVGYDLNISLNTYTAIQGKKEVKLYVYEAIREDAWQLFGFQSKKERDLFLLLISVSGVGANTARVLLSSLSPAELCNAISTGDERLIKGVKGIGLKTAQRIIVDLKDKIVMLGIQSEIPAGGSIDNSGIDPNKESDCIKMLVNMGYSPAPSAKVVRQILKENPEFELQQVFIKSLPLLSNSKG